MTLVIGSSQHVMHKPLVEIHCDTCGHVFYFDAAILEIFNEDEYRKESRSILRQRFERKWWASIYEDHNRV